MDCIHHWIVDSPNDTTDEMLHSQCRKCGTTKDIARYQEDSLKDWRVARFIKHSEFVPISDSIAR